MIYLDNAATATYTSIDDIVVNTIIKAMKEHWQNPSSLYATDVKLVINTCREQVAKFIGAEPDEIIFTSGASESNNMAIRGWFDKLYTTPTIIPNIITTEIEHKSILDMCKHYRMLEHYVDYCKVDEFGLVDLNYLEKLLKNNVQTLVSINFANNEIGTIQDIKKISDLVHKYNGVLHVDATQAFGHIPINVEELGIDMMSASGHKISPVLKGIGFLYKKNCINIQPLIYGSQEGNLRGGTENTFGIIGLSKALEFCDISTQKIQELCDKRDYFIELFKSKFDKSGFEIKLNGHPTQRLPNNINVVLPNNITGEALLYTLEMAGIYVSTGSACNSKEIRPSHVLKAIGLSDKQAMKTVRLSLSNDITYEEIDKVIEEIDKVIRIIEI